MFKWSENFVPATSGLPALTSTDLDRMERKREKLHFNTGMVFETQSAKIMCKNEFVQEYFTRCCLT